MTQLTICLSILPNKKLRGGFKCFLFSPLPGEIIQFDLYFSDEMKPPTRTNGWNPKQHGPPPRKKIWWLWVDVSPFLSGVF